MVILTDMKCAEQAEEECTLHSDYLAMIAAEEAMVVEQQAIRKGIDEIYRQEAEDLLFTQDWQDY